MLRERGLDCLVIIIHLKISVLTGKLQYSVEFILGQDGTNFMMCLGRERTKFVMCLCHGGTFLIR